MNKFEKLRQDHHRLQQEYDLVFRLKRKLEKENAKLKKILLIIKLREKKKVELEIKEARKAKHNALID